MEQGTTPKPLCALLFYALLFIFVTTSTVLGNVKHPLFPLDPSNISWSNNWLLTTVIDYYGVCFCLCGIIISTERSLTKGIIWSIGCCTFGSPICCYWMLYRLWFSDGTLSLGNHATRKAPCSVQISSYDGGRSSYNVVMTQDDDDDDDPICNSAISKPSFYTMPSL